MKNSDNMAFQPFEGIRILLIEDDEDDIWLIKHNLRDSGISPAAIHAVTRISEAKSFLASREVDVILLDLNVRDSMGSDTYLEIGEYLRNIPVIILSGVEDIEIARDAVKAGAQDYVAKRNLHVLEMAPIIRNAIERHRLFQELKESREKERQHSEFKSQFLARVSHEIRTPMNAVIGISDILLHSEELNPEQRSLVNTLSACGKYLTSLISDFLDISKIESGKMELVKTRFDFHEMLLGIAGIFVGQAEKKGVAFETLIGPEVPKWVLGDPSRLRQVIANLVSNAIKFTDAGNIKIEVSSQEVKPKQFCFLIKIMDSGCGIEKQHLDQVFREFYQVQPVFSESTRSSGLGLTITKSLIELMGGSIGCESEVGKGSTFWFDVTLELTEEGTYNLPNDFSHKRKNFGIEAGHESTQPAYRGVRALVVDDNLINLRVAARMLSILGCDVDSAIGAEEGLEYIKHRSYDVVFMDCSMPNIDGVTATRMIRQTIEPPKYFPIVALTANGYDTNRQECLDAGMNDFICKPVTIEDLKEKLGKVLQYAPLE
jgi:signal transduction histidine kinase